VAAVRIDQPDEDDGRANDDDAPDPNELPDKSAGASFRDPADADDAVGPGHLADADCESAARTAAFEGYYAKVDAVFRAYAIDRAYERVREIERDIVTPAMRRIEAEDPGRRLAGLEHSLKGKDRLRQKISEAVEERGHTVDQAFAMVKDAIRYTFCYPEEQYAQGVHADCDRIESAGFERVDRRNLWAGEEYKGVNSRWRVPERGQLFEVQFHTQASLDAKEETHGAYEQIRSPPDDDAEVDKLHAYQREVTAKIPTPPDAPGIPDYP
jgi:hypothetical protein